MSNIVINPESDSIMLLDPVANNNYYTTYVVSSALLTANVVDTT